MPGFFTVENKKWYVHVPEQVLGLRDKKILIVDDFALAGDFLDNLRTKLIASGFKANNIRTLCVATTKVAIQTHKAPNYYWMVVPDDGFYFPWGRAK